MTNLAANDRVYSTLNGGHMSDPPLFGVIDYIDGAGKDLVRVCWENGASQFFDTIVDTACRLQIYTTDTDEALILGNDHPPTSKYRSAVARSFMLGATRTVLIRIFEIAGRPLEAPVFAIVPYS